MAFSRDAGRGEAGGDPPAAARRRERPALQRQAALPAAHRAGRGLRRHRRTVQARPAPRQGHQDHQRPAAPVDGRQLIHATAFKDNETLVTELLGSRPTRHTPLGTDATSYLPARTRPTPTTKNDRPRSRTGIPVTAPPCPGCHHNRGRRFLNITDTAGPCRLCRCQTPPLRSGCRAPNAQFWVTPSACRAPIAATEDVLSALRQCMLCKPICHSLTGSVIIQAPCTSMVRRSARV
jgi:hypothetical protein